MSLLSQHSIYGLPGTSHTPRLLLLHVRRTNLTLSSAQSTIRVYIYIFNYLYIYILYFHFLKSKKQQKGAESVPSTQSGRYEFDIRRYRPRAPRAPPTLSHASDFGGTEGWTCAGKITTSVNTAARLHGYRILNNIHLSSLGNNFRSHASSRSHVHSQTNTHRHHSYFVSGQIRWWLSAEKTASRFANTASIFATAAASSYHSSASRETQHDSQLRRLRQFLISKESGESTLGIIYSNVFSRKNCSVQLASSLPRRVQKDAKGLRLPDSTWFGLWLPADRIAWACFSKESPIRCSMKPMRSDRVAWLAYIGWGRLSRLTHQGYLNWQP